MCSIGGIPISRQLIKLIQTMEKDSTCYLLSGRTSKALTVIVAQTEKALTGNFCLFGCLFIYSFIFIFSFFWEFHKCNFRHHTHSHTHTHFPFWTLARHFFLNTQSTTHVDSIRMSVGSLDHGVPTWLHTRKKKDFSSPSRHLLCKVPKLWEAASLLERIEMSNV